MRITELRDIKGYKVKGIEPFWDLNFHVRPQSWGINFHEHDYMQFLIVLEGSLIVKMEGK